jgi:hypothetical protein
MATAKAQLESLNGALRLARQGLAVACAVWHADRRPKLVAV